MKLIFYKALPVIRLIFHGIAVSGEKNQSVFSLCYRQLKASERIELIETARKKNDCRAWVPRERERESVRRIFLARKYLYPAFAAAVT